MRAAAPPMGARRWRPPAPAARWKGVREADRFGAACIQPTPRGASLYSDDIGPTSEDCLSLNVRTPLVRGRAPAIVWSHGGTLIGGANRSSLFDGARLAAAGTVVGALNYRLGIPGGKALSWPAPHGPLGRTEDPPP
jgi:para-nitrobenzyl esterase